MICVHESACSLVNRRAAAPRMLVSAQYARLFDGGSATSCRQVSHPKPANGGAWKTAVPAAIPPPPPPPPATRISVSVSPPMTRAPMRPRRWLPGRSVSASGRDRRGPGTTPCARWCWSVWRLGSTRRCAAGSTKGPRPCRRRYGRRPRSTRGRTGCHFPWGCWRPAGRSRTPPPRRRCGGGGRRCCWGSCAPWR
uniref:Uncharacterized protein n=1 Tax=uncultured Armatimonadetes bacterium TaxID=157466 RepID=A0A6J4IJ69_9BACT|nr:hypothetical protein AVDCRST_MAG63-2127 [uncultured Armatimonadetes bacterium]